MWERLQQKKTLNQQKRNFNCQMSFHWAFLTVLRRSIMFVHLITCQQIIRWQKTDRNDALKIYESSHKINNFINFILMERDNKRVSYKLRYDIGLYQFKITTRNNQRNTSSKICQKSKFNAMLRCTRPATFVKLGRGS